MVKKKKFEKDTDLIYPLLPLSFKENTGNQEFEMSCSSSKN